MDDRVSKLLDQATTKGSDTGIPTLLTSEEILPGKDMPLTISTTPLEQESSQEDTAATAPSSDQTDVDGLKENDGVFLKQPLDIMQDQQHQESGDAQLYGDR